VSTKNKDKNQSKEMYIDTLLNTDYM
jgi:hypothetical protein